MSWSPFQMKIILHHYGSFSECPQSNAPIFDDTVSRLKEIGVLENRQNHADGESPYHLTDLGVALVDMWGAQPLPVVTYVDPRFAEGQTR
ncbi:hypothetical protein ACHMW7_16100 [Aminobacter sp. UC22_36]|uniref:hypothetical protein n=1 Tax=Aminobacter sp. UC22_36 TaxID=3374549 RepID=UPI0037583485